MPTLSAFDAPVRGAPVGILLCRLAWKKLEWYGYPTVKKIDDMCIRFDMIHERDRHTDGRTDGQTPHDDIGRACIASRDKKQLVCTVKLKEILNNV